MKKGTCPLAGERKYTAAPVSREIGDARQQLHPGLAFPGRRAGQLRLRPVRLRAELHRQGKGPGGHQEKMAAGFIAAAAAGSLATFPCLTYNQLMQNSPPAHWNDSLAGPARLPRLPGGPGRGRRQRAALRSPAAALTRSCQGRRRSFSTRPAPNVKPWTCTGISGSPTGKRASSAATVRPPLPISTS